MTRIRKGNDGKWGATDQPRTVHESLGDLGYLGHVARRLVCGSPTRDRRLADLEADAIDRIEEAERAARRARLGER